jgi:hypothetical protein
LARSETVSIGKAQIVTIGGKRSHSVDKDDSLTVAGKRPQTVSKDDNYKSGSGCSWTRLTRSCSGPAAQP